MYDGRIEASRISSSFLETAGERVRKARERKNKRAIDKIVNPGPDFDEWIIDTFSRFPIAKPLVREVKHRRDERIDAAVRISFGTSLSPFEYAEFKAEEDVFMRNLSPRIKRKLDANFPPCPGCH